MFGDINKPAFQNLPIAISKSTNILLNDSLSQYAYKLPQIAPVSIVHLSGDTGYSNSSIAIGYGSKCWPGAGASSGFDSGGAICIGSYTSAQSGAINIGVNYVQDNQTTSSTAFGAKGTNAIAIGGNAIASGNAISMGKNAGATATNSISIGSASTAQGTNAIALGTGALGGAAQSIAIGYGGVIACAASFASSVAIGSACGTDFVGEFAYQTGSLAGSAGDAKISFVPMHVQTTSVTATEFGIGNANISSAPTNRLALTNDSTYLFDVDIAARNTGDDTQSAVWNLKFGIRRGVAAINTVLIGTPTKTIYGQDTGTTTWDVNVTADTTNGRPSIKVTGETAKTINWIANTKITKISG
jgi:hypothetical protein